MVEQNFATWLRQKGARVDTDAFEVLLRRLAYKDYCGGHRHKVIVAVERGTHRRFLLRVLAQGLHAHPLGIPMERRIFPEEKDEKGCAYEDMR